MCLGSRSVKDVFQDRINGHIVTPLHTYDNWTWVAYGGTMLAGTGGNLLTRPLMLPDGPQPANSDVWTGCDFLGNRHSNCNDFTDPAGTVAVGYSAYMTRDWIKIGAAPISCSGGGYRVYCYTDAPPPQAPSTAAPTTVAPTLQPTLAPTTATPTGTPTTAAPTVPTSAPSSAPTVRAAVLVWVSPVLAAGNVSMAAFADACNETVNGVALRGAPLVCTATHNLKDVLDGQKVVTPAPHGNFTYSYVSPSGNIMISGTGGRLLEAMIKRPDGSEPLANTEVWTGCDFWGGLYFRNNCNDFTGTGGVVSTGYADRQDRDWIRTGAPSASCDSGNHRIYCYRYLPTLVVPPTPEPTATKSVVNGASSQSLGWPALVVSFGAALALGAQFTLA